MAGFTFGETESVCADDGAVFKGDVVAQRAALAHHRVGMRKKMGSYLHPWIEHHMG